MYENHQTAPTLHITFLFLIGNHYNLGLSYLRSWQQLWAEKSTLKLVSDNSV